MKIKHLLCRVLKTIIMDDQDYQAQLDIAEKWLRIEKETFDSLCNRYDFRGIKEGVGAIGLNSPETETREDRLIYVLNLFEYFNPVPNLAYFSLTEYLESINGHVESFLLSFYELFFVQKIQNQL